MKAPRISTLSLLLVLSLAAVGAHPAAASPEAQETGLAQPSPGDYAAALKDATEALTALQTLIDQGKFDEAFTRALAIVKSLETRAGIRSKTPVPIDCGDILEATDLTKSFDELSPPKQFALSELLKKKNHGLFLDLLNAAKRANALYFRAQYLQMTTREGGKLTDRDLDFIRDGFKRIQEVKIYFTSAKLGKDLYLAFDSDLLEPTDIYSFNRELLDVVMKNEALHLDATGFDQLLGTYRKEMLEKHRATLTNSNPAGPRTGSGPLTTWKKDHGDGQTTLHDPTVIHDGFAYGVSTDRIDSGEYYRYFCAQNGLGGYIENTAEAVYVRNTPTAVLHVIDGKYVYFENAAANDPRLESVTCRTSPKGSRR